MSMHTIEDLMRHVRKIRHEQTRRESEDYLEMVMFRESWNDVLRLFEDYFGAPVKSPGEEPNDEAQRLSDPYGGVAKDQILYHASRDTSSQVAMVWPWSDGKRMTVKIVQECP